MKTKLTNGARTPQVIANELKRYGKLEGVIDNPVMEGISYEYYTTPMFGEDTPAMEITLYHGEAIAARKLSISALDYLIPNRSKAKDPNDFTFGGF